MIGTAGDPSAGGANLLANWQWAADNYDVVGAALAAEGLKYYLHPEQNNFNFFNDPAHPELSRVHRLDWFTENTDPSLVFFEPDILHILRGPRPLPGPSTAAVRRLGTGGQRAAHRGWHIKDGSRLSPPPGPGRQPVHPDHLRPPQFTGTPTNNVDTIYAREGSIGQGYPVDPDPAVVGFRRIFGEIGAKGSHAAISRATAAAGAADLGRSLRHAKISVQNLLGPRGVVHRRRRAPWPTRRPTRATRPSRASNATGGGRRPAPSGAPHRHRP